MTNKNDLAYPSDYMQQNAENIESMNCCKGLTKREYFAAMALQGLLACDRVTEFEGEVSPSTLAVALADALIEKLNKEDVK